MRFAAAQSPVTRTCHHPAKIRKLNSRRSSLIRTAILCGPLRRRRTASSHSAAGHTCASVRGPTRRRSRRRRSNQARAPPLFCSPVHMAGPARLLGFGSSKAMPGWASHGSCDQVPGGLPGDRSALPGWASRGFWGPVPGGIQRPGGLPGDRSGICGRSHTPGGRFGNGPAPACGLAGAPAPVPAWPGHDSNGSS